MDFPTGKKYGRLWHFQSIDRGFLPHPLHRCGIKLVNLDFYVSNFLAFRALWEPSKRFISNIRNIVPKEFLIPFGHLVIIFFSHCIPSHSWSPNPTQLIASIHVHYTKYRAICNPSPTLNKCKSKSKSYFGQNQSCGDLQIINNLILTDMGNSCISHLRETQYLGLVSIYVISYYIIIFWHLQTTNNLILTFQHGQYLY